MNQLIAVYITCPSEQEAHKIVQHFLVKRLIACANIIPAKSFYWWQGAIAHESEMIIIAKSIDSLFQKIEQEIRNIHSYDVPCIIAIKVQANNAYAQFVKNEIKQD